MFNFDPEVPIVRLFQSPSSSEDSPDPKESNYSEDESSEEEEIIIYTPPEAMNHPPQGFDQFATQIAALVQQLQNTQPPVVNIAAPNREMNLVSYPDFFGGEQDPITWIEEVEKAFDANMIPNDRKIAVITPRLRSSAATWWTIRRTQNPVIDRWNDNANLAQSFWPIFIQQFRTPALEAKWFTQLTQRKQLPGEDVDSYHNEMEEIIRRVEAGGHVYPDTTKAQIFINGLCPEYCIHISSLTPINLLDAYQKAKAYENAIKQNPTYAALLGFHTSGPSYHMNNPPTPYSPIPPYHSNYSPVPEVSSPPTNTTEAAINKLTEAVTAMMSQVNNL